MVITDGSFIVFMNVTQVDHRVIAVTITVPGFFKNGHQTSLRHIPKE